MVIVHYLKKFLVLVKFACTMTGVLFSGEHICVTCTCTVVTMVRLQFLTILLTVTCFLGVVVSITDKEFQVSNVHD